MGLFGQHIKACFYLFQFKLHLFFFFCFFSYFFSIRKEKEKKIYPPLLQNTSQLFLNPAEGVVYGLGRAADLLRNLLIGASLKEQLGDPSLKGGQQGIHLLTEPL